MSAMVECVPNFSEGRDKKIMEKIVEPFRNKKGVKLLDYQNDEDHNRMVVTVVGEPFSLSEAVIKSVGFAIENIDMTRHKGQHPRMGATDVIPFIPIKEFTMDQAIDLSKDVAKKIAEKFNLPVILYEASATAPHRRNLANIRKGQFEGMEEKLKNPEWKPDFGPKKIHPTAGITAIGARMPLVAYNVNLATDNLEIATAIANKVRHISGGFRYCKALGIELKDRGMVQVSMNLTNYEKTAIYRVFEVIRMEAKRYGVSVTGSEIVGLVPMAALIDAAGYYLGLENFSITQVLEARM